MDNASVLRVKFTFRTKIKLAKLDKANNTAFSSMANLRKLIFKYLPETEELVTTPKQRLAVECKDSAGDYITLEDDDDLDAMELLQKSNVEFSIDVLSAFHSSAHPASRDGRPGGMTFNHIPGGNYRTVPCRHFQSGFCSYGESCTFLHDLAEPLSRNGNSPYSRTESSPSTSWSPKEVGQSSPSLYRPNVRDRILQSPKLEFHQPTTRFASKQVEGQDYNWWLKRQLGMDSAATIQNLSGEEGQQTLFKIVKQRDLPHDTITRFVKLLAREEIRTSLLRQKTNQIYGVLIGSLFLLRLNNHIESHLGMIPTLKAEDVRPYLALTEELQSRTTDGWKEVPLNALKTVVLKLEQSTGKDELMAMVSRLADQSERLRRMQAVAPIEDQNFEGEKFRQMSIVPDKEELLDFQAKKNLPVNRIGIQYSQVSDNLETHFQLLREDCVDPLRQAYCSNRNKANSNSKHSESNAMQDLRIYVGVKLAGIRCGDHGVEFCLSFHLPSREKTAEQWQSSKKLMYGALLCISSDHFETFFWGVVSRRDVKDLAKGLVAIRIIGESDNDVTARLQIGQKSTEEFVMVESTCDGKMSF